MSFQKPTDLPETNEQLEDNFLDERLDEMDAESEGDGDPGAPPQPPH